MNNGIASNSGVVNTFGGSYRDHVVQVIGTKDLKCNVYSLGDIRLKTAIVEVEIDEACNYLFVNHSAINNRVQVCFSRAGFIFTDVNNYALSDITVESFSSTVAIPIPTMKNRKVYFLITDTVNLNSNYTDWVRLVYGYLPDNLER